jgi:hypothetical protein
MRFTNNPGAPSASSGEKQIMSTLSIQARRLICALGLIASSAASSADASPMSDGVALQCRALVNNADKAWSVELDSTIPLAVVNSHDVPADYSASHARLRLALDGPALVIGLKSGRLLVTDAQGKRIGYGSCQLPQLARHGDSDTLWKPPATPSQSVAATRLLSI